ncbi:VOC family protein [Streptomyces sp. NPDC014636]|uniref:VOC family protein n=1 Tax=Streptomyces sp. NPDC014636 TaxID=3364876 RepID=UPI0036FE09F5
MGRWPSSPTRPPDSVGWEVAATGLCPGPLGDVDETLGRVTALGGSVRGGPNDMPWGQRVAHIQDPDGNPVNLTQPIPAQ